MPDAKKPPIDRAQRAITIGLVLIVFFGGNAVYGLIASFGVDIPGVQWFKSQPVYLAVSWFGFGLGLGAMLCGKTLGANQPHTKDPS